MKKEEVLRIELPKGAEYRRVKVTDGIVSIVYAKESVKETVASNNAELKQANKEEQFTNRRVKRPNVYGPSSIPEIITEVSLKPDPLIGGTDVYQKDNGTDYWYCRIKEGRDEFMYVPFSDLTMSDLLYDSSGKEHNFVTGSECEFMQNVWNALKHKPKSDGVWIPVFEPSKNQNGKIQYVSGQPIFDSFDCCKWEMFLEAYSPQNESRMASTTTYFLLLLRWIKDEIATIKQLTESSRYISYYGNNYELSGERQFGGFYDFVGNTGKILKDENSKSGYFFAGGHSGLGIESLSDIVEAVKPEHISPGDVGLLELIR